MKDADFVIDEIVVAQNADPFDDEATTDALTDALNLIVEQRKQIGALERALEHMPKPIKLLDVFGDKYEKIVRCKDCKHGYKCEFDIRCENKNMPPMFGQHFSYNWFCADGEKR